MKNLILGIMLLMTTAAHAQSGVSASVLKMTPTALPAACRQGDIRVDSTNFFVQLCSATNTWTAYPTGGAVSIGTIDSQSASANGLTIATNVLYAQSADATHPGMVNASTQTFGGQKTFSTGVTAGAVQVTPFSSAGVVVNDSSGNLASAAQLTAVKGGTGLDTSASTGYAKVASGTWSVTTAANTFIALYETVATTLGDIVYGGASGTPTRLAGDTSNTKKFLTETASGSVATAPGWSTIASGDVPTLNQNTSGTAADLSATLVIGHGGTGVTSVTSAPTASAWAGWDANSNLFAFNLIDGYTTTATAAGTTTLAVGSKYQQYFTGSTTQTVVMPVVSTLVNGQQYAVTNVSSGTVTVQSSGANTIQAMAQNTQLVLTVKDATAGTGTSAWTWTYSAINNSSVAGGGTVASVTFTGDGVVDSSTPSSAVTTSGTVTATIKNQNAATVLAGPTSGSAAAPTFRALVSTDLPAPIYIPHVVQRLTSSSGTFNEFYAFFCSSCNATTAATFTNNSITYTVYSTYASSNFIVASGSGAPTSTGTLTKTGGTGDSTITFTSVLAPLWIRAKVVGGGGGGAGAGTSATNGTAGNTGTFSSALSAAGGAAGGSSNTPAGGACTCTASATVNCLESVSGGSGSGGDGPSVASGSGGIGGNSTLGGGGGAGTNAGVGAAGSTNSGGGGGGAGGGPSAGSGSGGGAGGTCIGMLTGSALTATISYTTAANVAGGTGGTAAGGGGAAGVEEIELGFQ